MVIGSSRSSVDDGIYDRERHAAQIDICIASYELIYLPIPVLKPLFGIGRSPVESVNRDSSFRIRRR